MLRRLLTAGAVILAGAVFGAGIQPRLSTDAISVPQQVNYQGKLTDGSGNPVPNGNYSMQFKLYDGVTQVWSEVQTVAVADGLFNVLLGASIPIPSIPDAGPCSLEVIVNSEAVVPKIPFVSAAYTYNAQNADEADKLDGDHASAFATAGHTHDANGDVTGTVTGTLTLSTTGVTPGSYTLSNITVDAKGRITSASNGSAGNGSVTSVSHTTGVVCSPNPITTTGTVGFDQTYGDNRYINEGQLAAGDLTGTYPNPTIAQKGATSGQMLKWNGSAWLPGNDNNSGGTVTSVTQSTGIVCVPNPITTTGTVAFDQTWGDARYSLGSHTHTLTHTGDATGSGAVGGSWPLTLSNTGVSAGSYTNASLTVDAKGRLTAASSGSAGSNYWTNSGSYIYPNTPSSNTNIQINGSYPMYASSGSNTAIYGNGTSGSYAAIVGNNAVGTGVRANGASASYVAFYGYNSTTGASNGGRIENASSNGYPALWCYNPSGPGLTVQGYGSSYYHTYLNGGSSGAPALSINGYMVASGTKSCVVKTSQGSELLFCTEAPDVEFYTNGTSQLVNGTATVEFERLYKEAISTERPVRVVVVPAGSWSAIYVVSQTPTGFMVKSESGDLNAKFNWIAIGIRKGYESRPVLPKHLQPSDEPAPTPAAGSNEGGGKFRSVLDD